MKTRGLAIVSLLLVAFAVTWFAGGFASDVAPPAAPMRGTAEATALASGNDRMPEAALAAPQRDTVAVEARVRRVRVMTVSVRGDAVGGAEVRYWPPASRGEREHAARLAGTDDVEALLRSSGRAAVTDARGVVEIEADERSPVCARKGDAYGEAVVGSADSRWADELRVELQRDVVVAAEVVDADDRPVADQHVALDARFVSRLADGGARATAITGSDGVATFAHVLNTLAWPADAANGQLRFRCEATGATKQTLAERLVPFDPLHAPERVRLVVPSAGTVLVTAKDADGGLLEPECWLEDGRGDFREATRAGDRSVFHQVPFGVRWTLVMRGGTYRHQRTVEGPDAGNPVVQLTITVPLRPVELRARVVRRGGDPVAGANVEWKCAVLANHEVAAVTDESGAIPFGRLFWSGSNEQDRLLEIAVSSKLIEPRTFTFDRRIARGTTDLGDLVVEPVAGETVLVTIEPRCEGAALLEGVWARLGQRAEPEESRLVGQSGRASSRGFTMQANIPVFVRRRGDVLELCGGPLPGPFVLHCGHPDCVPVRDLPVALGEHKVIELQRAATLRVSMLPPDVPRARIHGVLTRLGEQDGVQVPFEIAQSSLTFEGVAPGGYTLRVEVDECVIHETAGIALAAGDNRWPPDVTSLDLRTAVRMIEVRAVEPGTEKRVAVQVIDVPAGSTAAVHRRGRETFGLGGLNESISERLHPLPVRPVDLLVRAPGYAPARVVRPSGDVDVQLQRSGQIELDSGDVTDAKVRVRIVDDALRDDALRSFDLFNTHTPEMEFFLDPRFTVLPPYVPGTVVEVVLVRDGTAGAPQRVVIDSATPQKVTLR